MPTTYDIATNADDWYQVVGGSTVTGTILLKADFNNVLFPSVESWAIGDIDTSGIGTDIVSNATFYFYADSYTVLPARRGAPTKTYKIWMLKTDETNWMLIKSGTYTATGWISEVLTAAEYAEIDRDGKTRFRITVDDPGAGKARILQVRAREYTTEGDWDMYLLVSHAPPVTDLPRRTLLGVGL